MEGAYRWRKEYGGLKVSTTTRNAHTHRWDIDLQHQWHGKAKIPWGMEKWKASNASHFSTPLTAAAS